MGFATKLRLPFETTEGPSQPATIPCEKHHCEVRLFLETRPIMN